MVPPPVAQGLLLCQQVIVEEGTKNVSLINIFRECRVKSFPSILPFFAVALLRDAEGGGTIELMIVRDETDEVVYDLKRPAQFTNRLAGARATFHIEDCSFPAAGLYQATLLVDNEWIAHARFRVSLLGGES
jgi:hypothetical protein